MRRGANNHQRMETRLRELHDQAKNLYRAEMENGREASDSLVCKLRTAANLAALGVMFSKAKNYEDAALNETFAVRAYNDALRYGIAENASAEKSRIGSQRKNRPWLEVAELILSNEPTLPAKTAWDRIPTDCDSPLIVTDDREHEWECYRDGNEAVAVRDRNGEERTIKERAFRNHVKTAKQNLKG